ncbi:MAG: hypothetical protein CM15mV46_250 [Caudoviricetes sp.]|nr:MAG: hypothetical protein CM15mV46_250 [Caudoviricetes sp.]
MNPQFYQVKIGNYAIDENELDYPLESERYTFYTCHSWKG